MNSQIETDRTPKQKRGRERRDAIIAAATDIFLERGYGNVSLDDILARSGGSRRNIYDWFGNKEALLSVVIENACEEFLGSIEIPESTLADPREALRAFGFTFIKTLTSPKAIALYQIVVGECARFPGLGKTLHAAGPVVGRDRLAACLEQWHQQGLICAPDPGTAAEIIEGMFWSQLHLSSVLLQRQPSDSEIANHVDAAVEIALGGILRPSDG